MPHPACLRLKSRAALILALLANLALGDEAVAQSSDTPRAPYLYRWSFDIGGLPESEFRDGVRGGELTIGGGEMDGAPIFHRQGGVGAATPGVLNASRNRYGSTQGAQINSFGSPLRTIHALPRFTITMWIKPGLPVDQQPYARLLNISPETDEQAPRSILLALEADGLGFRVNGSPAVKIQTSEPVIKQGQWVFLAFSYDGVTENPYYSREMSEAVSASHNAAILAGGIDRPTRLVSPFSITTGGPNYNVSPGAVSLDKLLISVASSNSRFDRAFVGWIDDVRIYPGLLPLSALEQVRLEALGK